MIFSEKLQIIRKSKGITQEELAEVLLVSRQAVAKWESGQSYPDIINLIRISELFKVTVDYLVKDSDCEIKMLPTDVSLEQPFVDFLVLAKQNTYAANKNRSESTRTNSIDYRYEAGDFVYLDTYIGGEHFIGEEAIWIKEQPIYAMNYSGRVLADTFSGNFLKEALKRVPMEKPFRGPDVYVEGAMTYQCKLIGSIEWFQGYEEIYCENQKVYECYFHGGTVK